MHKAYESVNEKFREARNYFLLMHNLVEPVQEAPGNFESVHGTVLTCANSFIKNTKVFCTGTYCLYRCTENLGFFLMN
jgi:hypothetical protein